MKKGQAVCSITLFWTSLTNLRYVNELAKMTETFIDPLLYQSGRNINAPPTSSSHLPSPLHVTDPADSTQLLGCQLPEDLWICLEVIENDLLEGHVRLSEALKKRYEEQYPLVRSLAEVFVNSVCCFIVVRQL